MFVSVSVPTLIGKGSDVFFLHLTICHAFSYSEIPPVAVTEPFPSVKKKSTVLPSSIRSVSFSRRAPQKGLIDPGMLFMPGRDVFLPNLQLVADGYRLPIGWRYGPVAVQCLNPSHDSYLLFLPNQCHSLLMKRVTGFPHGDRKSVL